MRNEVRRWYLYFVKIAHIVPGLDKTAPTSLLHAFEMAQESISVASSFAKREEMQIDVHIATFLDDSYIVPGVAEYGSGASVGDSFSHAARATGVDIIVSNSMGVKQPNAA